jgi:2-amino-4-hydroxy-6-hydroxymethyldihydropteridine diphosphokinase
MILIAIGSNVPGPWGDPDETVRRAIERLDEAPLRLAVASTSLRTSPFGVTDQPDFVNAVVAIETTLGPAELMQHLHGIELEAERRRTLRWGPRTLDLDLIDYDGTVGNFPLQGGHHGDLLLPHPGIAERDFVLAPIAEIAPDWRHPVTGETAAQMLARLEVDKGVT